MVTKKNETLLALTSTINQKAKLIKNHICENKKVYIAAAAGLVVGAVAVLVLKKVPEISMPRLLSPGDNNIMKVFINPLGDPGNVVQCLETGTIYASQGQAARELGVMATDISNHLRGRVEHINGFHLIILGKAGQVLAENT